MIEVGYWKMWSPWEWETGRRFQPRFSIPTWTFVMGVFYSTGTTDTNGSIVLLP